MTDDTDQPEAIDQRPAIPVGKPWQPGQSGNPGGRPKVTAEVRRLAQEHSASAIAELARLATSAENEGTRVAACNALLDRGLGKAPASVPEPIELPDTTTPAGIVQAVAVVLQAVAGGNLTASEAGDLVAILETQRKAIETTEFEERLRRLETTQSQPTRGWAARG